MTSVGKVRLRIAMSLDGFTSGPEQSRKNPLESASGSSRGCTTSAVSS